ncbi:hypothetical protein PgNI_06485 [Pyricularia grisea]|uniref:Rhodopsin domain-containing protein n=1 Tax=Pyricularia grisea TaxID=148305 RepID=A0A6P8B7P8_PYRGI|nr:hypothetical protein PgNI_06485 [Pyricularia grisea]TLD11300.1 hypothetical protein PgNI_06485 [Pyricularia grisea]
MVNVTASMDPSLFLQLDFTDKSNLQGLLIGGFTALLLMVIIVILLRIYVRAWMARDVKADDYLIFAAAAFNVSIFAVSMQAVHYGFGKHIWKVATTPTDIFEIYAKIYRLTIPFAVIFKLSFILTKLSIVVSLLSVFGTNRLLRNVMITTAVVSTAATFSVMMIYVFQCSPIPAGWDLNLVFDARCFSVVTLSQAGSWVIIVTDLIFCVFPMPYLWRLNMPLKKRIALCGIFAIGLVACAATVMRFLASTNKMLIDTTYEGAKALGWSYIESSLGIICASVPSLAPLLSWAESRRRRISDPERRAAAANKPRTRMEPSDQKHRRHASGDGLDDVTYTGDTFVDPRDDGKDEDYEGSSDSAVGEEDKVHTMEKIAPVDSVGVESVEEEEEEEEDSDKRRSRIAVQDGGLSPPPQGGA